jgi:very-short-patch-repair endonuclease
VGVKRQIATNRAQVLRRKMSGPEKVLWQALRKPDLGFRRQVPIGRYVADFVCFSARLIVEGDGGWHDLPERQWHDLQRDEWLKAEGYRVVRFRDQRVLDDVQQMVVVIKTLLPRGEKGRDEGERDEFSCVIWEAGPPQALTSNPSTLTLPSLLEGEG